MIGEEREIQFTDEHMEQIRMRQKKTTMRTVKRDHVYPVGSRVTVTGTDLVLEITHMALVRFGAGVLEKISGRGSKTDWLHLEKNERGGTTIQLPSERVSDEHAEEILDRALEKLAELEGFDGHEEMMAWFRGENPMGLEYNLPQPFFLYRFKPVRRSDSD